jgi:hypothetical protein
VTNSTIWSDAALHIIRPGTSPLEKDTTTPVALDVIVAVSALAFCPEATFDSFSVARTRSCDREAYEELLDTMASLWWLLRA